MKLKKIFVVGVVLLSVFLIYLTTMDRKVYYLALGDSIALGNKISYPKLVTDYLNEHELLEESRLEFIKDDLRITDLSRNIIDNQKVMINGKEKTLKNALIKADLLTISIGNEELFYKMKTEKPSNLYHYIDEMMEDMETLFKQIREYCKEDIFLLGYVNPYSSEMSEYISYANQKLESLCKKYELEFISLNALTHDDFNELGLTNQGQKRVSQLLFPMIEKKVIKDEK